MLSASSFNSSASPIFRQRSAMAACAGTSQASRGAAAAQPARGLPVLAAVSGQPRLQQWQQHMPAAAAATLGSIRRFQQVPHTCLQHQQPWRRRPEVVAAAAAAAAAAGDAQPQPWQPPQQPTGLFRLSRISLWSLGGPLAWGYMLGYLGLMLILPISALLAKASLVPLQEFVARAAEPVALSAYFVSFSMALLAGAVNAVFGFLLAWVLVKYEFPGKKWIDAAVDLPFALPTSVAGLTLATVYGEEGILGRLLMSLGVNVVYTRLGVAVAMIFVSFPFVVRTMQPVLQEMEKEVEEAAWSLGASPWQTFTQVLLPPLLPPLLTGTALAFSRALGEFGSVVIVSSNFPYKDLIAPVLIFQCLEQYDFVGATVIGTVLLLISLVMMVGVNWLQSYSQRFRK